MIMITILISMQVGRLMVEEEAVRREKIAGCNAAREMHEAQVVPYSGSPTHLLLEVGSISKCAGNLV